MKQRSIRSPFLRAIRRAYALTRKSEQPGSPPLDELMAQSREVRSGIDRRKFLGDSAKAALYVSVAGLLASCSKEEDLLTEGPFYNKKKPNGAQPRIAIVGAGMAGLNCAYQLQKKGYYSTLYESSDRAGGRIITKQNLIAPGLYTECGGEFIDTGHLHMRGLAAEFGLPLLDTEDEQGYLNDTFYVDGQLYSEEEVIEAFAPYANTIASDISSLPTYFGFDNFTPAVQQFDLMSISGYFDSIGLPATSFLRKGLEEAYNTEYGREVNDQTAINFLFLFTINPGNNSYDIFGASDERYKVLGGNQRVPDALALELEGQIMLEHRLESISMTNVNSYQLSFSNGTTVEAEFVVVTIPFTTLRHVELGGLDLPEWKTNAINNLGYGTNAKLIIGFNQKVWRNYGHAGGVFTNGSAQNPTQFIQTGWDSSRMQEGNIGSFTVYQGGFQGEALDQSQTETFVNQLEQMWPGAAAAFSGQSRLIHWPSHPHTLASYSCWRVGQVTTIMGAEGRAVGNLFFAGEHTSNFYQGYMEGAAETGDSVAKEVVKALKAI